MINLAATLATWGTAEFEQHFKSAIANLDHRLLPLQACLSQSSYVADSDLKVVVLKTTETPESVWVKTGIFFAGIIAGSCCADDPTPVEEQPEYCELEFTIDKNNANTVVTIPKE